MIDWNGNKGYTDASSLGLPPGRWENTLTVQINNVLTLFTLTEVTMMDSEVTHAVYSHSNLTLTVFND